jgi:hypothetical protein
MSDELESDGAMVVMELWWRFRVIGADGVQVGYYRETETECAHESPSLSSTNTAAPEDHVSGHSLADCTFPA